MAIYTAQDNASTSRNDSEAHCIWYGECNKKGLTKQNCPYDGPPKLLNNSDAIHTLSSWCPHLVPDLNSAVSTCCDVNQITTFSTNIELAASLLKRCPSCMMNLAKHLCDFTCGPKQSNYMEVVSVKNNSNGQSYIDEVNLYITNDYLNGTFSSCKQVSVPSGGSLALDLMCGLWGAAKCSPMRWFSYMGDANNPFVPFQINYKNVSGPVNHTDHTFEPLNPQVTPCSQPFDVS
ncbi:hypothetical protein BDFB_012047 [Asbolus verrucosus]|uniref:Niemann-Pick C1 N-terminal domain-containing protein n=1 Tax=Asbolus verrucosus TaxID=1661398 RepID=A0A482VMQ1_ASBVE|nr:hypothetical protein BDFB_012047 [Asbolus verrucosus]